MTKVHEIKRPSGVKGTECSGGNLGAKPRSDIGKATDKKSWGNAQEAHWPSGQLITT